MSWVATAVVGGTVVGSLISADAAGDASQIQADATNAATAANTQASASSIEEQRRQFDINTQLLKEQNAQGRLDYDQQRADYERAYGDNRRDFERQYADTRSDYERARADIQPYREAGVSALSNLRGMLDSGPAFKKFTLEDFWEDPVTKASYQVGLDEGTKAINSMAGARGGRNSGATLKALTKFGTDYTGTQAAGSAARFASEQDREAAGFNNKFGRYATVASMGSGPSPNSAYVNGTNLPGGPAAPTGTAGAQAQLGAQNAATVGQLMTGTAGANGQLLTGGANARGAAAITQANNFSGGINTVGNWFSQQATLDKILNANRNRPQAISGSYDGYNTW